MNRQSAVALEPRRQPSQYSCCTTSLAMSLQALGFPKEECKIDRVNAVVGAAPLHGASWEQVAGAASHYGCRATLVIPATLSMVKKWTDKGTPVIIAWNLGNSWSHASVLVDITEDSVVIADPNCPNPNQLIRTMSHDEFYEKWWEKSSQGYKIRRPAMAIEREITEDGKQVVASLKTARTPQPVQLKKPESHTLHIDPSKSRDPAARALVNRPGKGPHKDRPRDVEHGAKPKHPVDWSKEANTVASRYLDAGYSGNPNGADIYPNKVDHGYGEPLAGGTDVMRKLQNRLLQEQGNEPRPESPRLASYRNDPVERVASRYLNREDI